MMPGMMNDEKKGIGAMIVGKDGMIESDGVEHDSEAGLSAATDDIMNAIHAKDAGGLKSALKSFIEMSKPEEESDESSEDDAGSDGQF